MIFKYELSDKVKGFIENSNLKEISIGCSDSQVVEITKDEKKYFLKMSKEGLLTSEYKKLDWLKGKLYVPNVELYDNYNGIEYLITTSVNGEMVCSDYYINNPELGLKVIADSFKNIYSVNIDNCPFNVDIDYKLKLVENNVKNKLVTNNDLKDSTLEKFKTVEELLKYLKDNRFNEEKCFSHGDTSLPNIFASKDKFEGFIDVGECGIADKWFDLAICEKSIIRNYGQEYVERFYEELNIVPDRNKINYYLYMMELYL